MKKEAEDKGVGTVDAVGEQNGHSESDDWTKALEREKLELEIEKIKTDKLKTELDIRDMDRPFYKRKEWLQIVIPSLITLLSTAATIGITTYLYSFRKLEGEYGDAKSQLANVNKELISAQKQRDLLTSDIADANRLKDELLENKKAIQTQLESKQKELEENQREIDKVAAQLRDVNGQLDSARIDKVLALQKVNDLRAQLEPLEKRKAELEKDVITLPLVEAVKVLATKNLSPTTTDTFFREVGTLYKDNRQHQQDYIRALEKYHTKMSAEGNAVPSLILYYLTDSPKWRVQLLNLTKEYLSDKSSGDIDNTETLIVQNDLILNGKYLKSDRDKAKICSLIIDLIISRSDADRLRIFNLFAQTLVDLKFQPEVDFDTFFRIISLCRNRVAEFAKWPLSEQEKATPLSLYLREAREQIEPVTKVLWNFSEAAYVSLMANILAEDKFVNRNFRSAVIVDLSTKTDQVDNFSLKIIKEWVAVKSNREIVDLWIDPTFSDLRRNEKLFKNIMKLKGREMLPEVKD